MSGDGGPFHRANKQPLAGWLVTRLLIDPAIRRAFGAVWLRAHRETLRLRGASSPPVIFCATHSGWWDGYMASLVNRKLFRHDTYLMMEEANLRRFPFFTWVGVFGVDRDNPRSAVRSIDYIAGVLREGVGRSLWMFPQGTMAHPDARPLALYSGAAHIARRVPGCRIVPVALRYDFLMEQTPEAFIRIGPPMPASEGGARELTTHLREGMTREADALHRDVMAYDLRAYRRIYSGRASINRAWERVVRLARNITH